MKKAEFHLNDYVVNEDNKVCRVVGTRLEPCEDFIEQPTQMLTLTWREDKDGKSVTHVEEVDALKVQQWGFNMAVLTAIGFKKGGMGHTVAYRDPVSRRSIVIDRTDGSIYVFLNSNHIMVDFTFVDAVHEIQHVFDEADVEFPNLSSWLFTENAKRKPPIRLHKL